MAGYKERYVRKKCDECKGTVKVVWSLHALALLLRRVQKTSGWKIWNDSRAVRDAPAMVLPVVVVLVLL
jgi:hypothetical protein